MICFIIIIIIIVSLLNRFDNYTLILLFLLCYSLPYIHRRAACFAGAKLGKASRNEAVKRQRASRINEKTALVSFGQQLFAKPSKNDVNVLM